MEGKQTIYYALGILAFAIAKADGRVQPKEKEKLLEIINREMDHDMDFEYAEIIFQLLQRDNLGFQNNYKWAMEELNKGRHYLSPELKEVLIRTIKAVAMAFNNISEEEKKIIDQFEIDIKTIGSDHYLK